MNYLLFGSVLAVLATTSTAIPISTLEPHFPPRPQAPRPHGDYNHTLGSTADHSMHMCILPLSRGRPLASAIPPPSLFIPEVSLKAPKLPNELVCKANETAWKDHCFPPSLVDHGFVIPICKANQTSPEDYCFPHPPAAPMITDICSEDKMQKGRCIRPPIEARYDVAKSSPVSETPSVLSPDDQLCKLEPEWCGPPTECTGSEEICPDSDMLIGNKNKRLLPSCSAFNHTKAFCLPAKGPHMYCTHIRIPCEPSMSTPSDSEGLVTAPYINGSDPLHDGEAENMVWITPFPDCVFHNQTFVKDQCIPAGSVAPPSLSIYCKKLGLGCYKTVPLWLESGIVWYPRVPKEFADLVHCTGPRRSGIRALWS